MIEDAERLRHIVEDLLLLARMDARSLPLNFTPVALNDIFLEVFEHLHPLAQQKNLAINFEKIDLATVNGDSPKLEFCNQSLVDFMLGKTWQEISHRLYFHTLRRFSCEDENLSLTDFPN